MAGLTYALTDIDFTSDLGLALPVTRGLMRYFLPGSAACNDTDQAGSGFSAALLNGTPYNTREAWDLIFTPGPSYAFGGYDPDIPIGSTPRPPVTLISVGRNGATLGNHYSTATVDSTVLLDVVDGVFGTNTQTVALNASGYNGPSITLDASYATQYQFYAVVLDWASGGNATETLYYGRGGTLTSASTSQAAIAHTSTLNYPLTTAHGVNAAKNGSTTSGARSIAHIAVHDVALTADEIIASYEWLQRFFVDLLPNNGL